MNGRSRQPVKHESGRREDRSLFAARQRPWGRGRTVDFAAVPRLRRLR